MSAMMMSDDDAADATLMMSDAIISERLCDWHRARRWWARAITMCRVTMRCLERYAMKDERCRVTMRQRWWQEFITRLRRCWWRERRYALLFDEKHYDARCRERLWHCDDDDARYCWADVTRAMREMMRYERCYPHADEPMQMRWVTPGWCRERVITWYSESDERYCKDTRQRWDERARDDDERERCWRHALRDVMRWDTPSVRESERDDAKERYARPLRESDIYAIMMRDDAADYYAVTLRAITTFVYLLRLCLISSDVTRICITPLRYDAIKTRAMSRHATSYASDARCDDDAMFTTMKRHWHAPASDDMMTMMTRYVLWRCRAETSMSRHIICRDSAERRAAARDAKRWCTRDATPIRRARRQRRGVRARWCARCWWCRCDALSWWWRERVWRCVARWAIKMSYAAERTITRAPRPRRAMRVWCRHSTCQRCATSRADYADDAPDAAADAATLFCRREIDARRYADADAADADDDAERCHTPTDTRWCQRGDARCCFIDVTRDERESLRWWAMMRDAAMLRYASEACRRWCRAQHYYAMRCDERRQDTLRADAEEFYYLYVIFFDDIISPDDANMLFCAATL